MTYIRTKYGKVFDQESWKHEVEYIYPKADIASLIQKESDNIEKLFDKIVHFYQFDGEQMEWEFASEHDLGLPDWKRQYAFHIKEHHLEVRGAIFTEWGMKYVAKLNENGEWELL